MSVILDWFATSPYASAVKAGLGAMLAYLLANIDDYGLPPIVYVAVIAAVPLVINVLNPKDTRVGIKGKVK